MFLKVHPRSWKNSLLSDDACKHDAIVLVDQPGLHASDLRNLPSNSHIAQSLSSAPSSRQFAYVPLTLPTTSTDSSLSVVARTASEKCGFQLVTTMPRQGGASFSNEKSIILSPYQSWNRESRGKEKLLNTMLFYQLLFPLSFFEPPHHRHRLSYSLHFVLYKRQEPETSSVLSSALSNASAKQKNGILHNYQLLTPALIMTLLVVLFLFLPIMYFGSLLLRAFRTQSDWKRSPK
ncbi:hypothetical protein K435DRAFT_850768 [Dendrothele bispora CBS 962.96]|uniref:Protein BIG1 n=1 Tax=Dendrothele bispora (strain CBS 962.96) TaxID=1314807 RepID=A0A4S8MNU5_DENBC|nr:hypothetical protein K435DRAFT_850768 [Dendrothele bispora CBS 962.96]